MSNELWSSMQSQSESRQEFQEVNGKRFDKIDFYQTMITNLISLSDDTAGIVIFGEKQTKRGT